MRGILLSLLVVGLVGCGSTPTTAPSGPPTPKKENTVKGGGHDHDDGPHGGTVFDLGKYHAEFLPDHDKKEATLWILGDDEKSPVAVAVEKFDLSIAEVKSKDKPVPAFQAELKAMPQEGDPQGKSSRFVAKHEGFGIETEFAGVVRGKIDDKPAEGKFAEKPHKK